MRKQVDRPAKKSPKGHRKPSVLGRKEPMEEKRPDLPMHSHSAAIFEHHRELVRKVLRTINAPSGSKKPQRRNVPTLADVDKTVARFEKAVNSFREGVAIGLEHYPYMEPYMEPLGSKPGAPTRSRKGRPAGDSPSKGGAAIPHRTVAPAPIPVPEREQPFTGAFGVVDFGVVDVEGDDPAPVPEREQPFTSRGSGNPLGLGHGDADPPSQGGQKMEHRSGPQRPSLSSYRNSELMTLTFKSDADIESAIRALFRDADLAAVPFDLADSQTLFVPSWSIPVFASKGLDFEAGTLIDETTRSTAELAEQLRGRSKGDKTK